MASMTTHIRIPEINRTLTVQLYFPTDVGPTSKPPAEVNGVITLLHGRSNTPEDWLMMTAAPRYAAENGYILIAPQADNSFFLNMAYGDAFYTALTEYLPAQLGAIFHIPTEREKNFIAGLSMGGYGALLFALRHPERYAACGSFSGSLAVRQMMADQTAAPELRNYAISLVGQDLQLADEWDLFALAAGVAGMPIEQQPRILCTCGRQDSEFVHIADQNAAFAKHARALNLRHTYLEWDGDHDFAFWDRSLAEFIGFIQGSNYARGVQQGWAAPATPVR